MSEILNIELEGKKTKLEILELENWKLENEKQKIFPYFTGKGTETVKDGVPTYKRQSVIAIIKHDKEDKYLCVDSKVHKCKSFVMGGIEENETPEQAALREIEEETGYIDISIKSISPIAILNHFYASYKGDFNRLSTLYIVFGKLNTEKNVGMSEKEKAKHNVKWINKSELKKFLTLEHNKFALDLLEGKKTYTGKGAIIK